MGRKSNAAKEQGAAALVAEGQQTQSAEQESAPEESAKAGKAKTGGKLVPMCRDEPAFAGGPTTADVHPDEVNEMTVHGWRVA